MLEPETWLILAVILREIMAFLLYIYTFAIGGRVLG